MRARLPNRRMQEVFDLVHDNHEFTVGVGRREDGSLAEVFISCHKLTTPMDILGRDAATIISIATQYGVPLEEIRGAVCRTEDGKPQSFVGAVLDAIGSVDGPKGT